MTQQAPTSLSEEERLLIDGHMIALLVTAFHDDGMDGRRVQRLALLAVKALRPIIDRLNHEVADYLRSPAGREKFATFNVDLRPSTPEQMASRIRNEIPVFTKAMRAAGIEAE